MDKKGFTLIELLAVIVVLAVVTVLATTTVLPYMSNARESAFRTDITHAVKSAKTATDLYNMNQLELEDTDSCVVANKEKEICFAIDDLIDWEIYDADEDVFDGTIYVNYKDSKNPTYKFYIEKGAEFNMVVDTASTETNYTKETGTIVSGGLTDQGHKTCVCE